MTRITLTLAVPAPRIPAANELACIGGLKAADRQTFREPRYVAAGVEYAVTRFSVPPVWIDAMTGPLWEPAWGADVALAQTAQAVLDLGTEEAEPVPSANTITVYEGEDYARWIAEHLTLVPVEHDE